MPKGIKGFQKGNNFGTQYGFLGKRAAPLSKESRRKLGIALKKTFSDPAIREKRRQLRLGKKHPEEVKRKISEGNKGKTFSKETREKMSIAKRGIFLAEKSNFWKGGKTDLTSSIRTLWKYRAWRNFVFERDRYVCIQCGYDKGNIIEADHIIPLAQLLDANNVKNIKEAIFCDALWDINNGRTLCRPCHKKTDTWGIKARVKKFNYHDQTGQGRQTI